MSRQNSLGVILVAGFFLLSGEVASQDFFGKWTLDWSGVLNNIASTSNEVAESFIQENEKNSNNPIWVLSEDSLRIYQNEKIISSAAISWKKENQFYILSDKPSQTHTIEKIDSDHIKMRSKQTDGALLLRRL